MLVIVFNTAVLHNSVGDMLRKEADQGTELGLKAKPFLDKAQLVCKKLLVVVMKGRSIRWGRELNYRRKTAEWNC